MIGSAVRVVLSSALVAVVVGLVAVLPAGPGAAATPIAAPAAHRSVIVVGVAGLRWDDVSARGTPTLWRLARHASVGSLSVRAAGPRTCPLDGWLTLGAGNRARGPATDTGCATPRLLPPPRPVAGGGVVLPGFVGLRADNDGLSSPARVGLLGQQLAQAGDCVAAVGPAAAYGAADRRGRVPVYAGDLSATAPTLFARCPLTLVALDELRREPPSRATAITRIDRDLAVVDAARPAGSTLLIVGLSETGTSAPRLHLALASGPGRGGQAYVGGALHSSSTRRTPFVQLIDVAPTVLNLLGVATPAVVTGEPWQIAAGRPASERATVARLVDLDLAARAERLVVTPFFAIVVLSQAVFYLAAAIALRRRSARSRRRQRLLTATRVTGLSYAAVPVCTYLANLVPWWRADHLLLAVFGVVALADAVIVALALLGPWRRRFLGPFGVVAGLTFLVLAADVVTGAHLQLSSLAGYTPLVAGRFAGFGNVAYAVFATAALLFAAALAHGRSRRTALALTLGVGAVAVVLDGSPLWGSDLGGVLALVPGTAVLAMMTARVRVSLPRFVLACGCGAVVVTVFAVGDYLRPAAQRTHLGRFVGQVLDGTAGTVIERKATANLTLLTHNWLTVLLPVGVALLALVLLRPARMRATGLVMAFERSRALQAGLVAVLVTSVVGFFVNDSGVSIPALASTLAVPLAVAASMRALEFECVAGPPALVRC